MNQNSYDGKATLYVVPTPIGNLDDITLRALEILKNEKYILAEDTRVTKQLLDSYNIFNKTLISSHKYNESGNFEKVINLLKNNNNVVLVSDRGTPLISDPGSYIVNHVIDNNFNVVALPGASAFLPALNMSGISSQHFLFYGFLSQKENESLSELKMLSQYKFTIVLYESPHRLIKTLQKVRKILGNIEISISREITKLHEEVFRGLIEDAISYFNNPRGEFVIVINNNNKEVSSIDDALVDLEDLLTYNIKPTDAYKYISKKYNISKNLLYDKIEERK